MMRPGFLFEEMWTGLRRSLSAAVAIVIVTTTSLLFLGMGLLSDRQVQAAKGYWYDRVEVSVFLCPQRSNEPACAKGAVTDAQRRNVQMVLESLAPATVQQVYYESQDEAYQRFQEQFRGNPTFSDTRKEAIPSAFRVKLADPSQYPVVQASVGSMPGVAAVNDAREVLDPLIRTLSVTRAVALGLAAVMLLATVLLTSTMIRQIAWARRREVAIKRMVGASKAAIRLPFVLEVLLASLVGAALATLGLWAVVRFGLGQAVTRYRDFAWVTQWDVFAVSGWLFLVAAVVAVLVSWFSLSRHVRV